MDQRELAEVTGIPYGTLKGVLREGGPAPSTDQALAIANVCGVPAWFIHHGWTPPAAEINTDRLDQLDAKYDELAGRFDAYLDLIRNEAVRAAKEAVAQASRTSPASAPSTPAKSRPGQRKANGPQ